MDADGKRGWRRFVNPVALIPILLVAALMAFLFSVANAPQVVERIRDIPWHVWAISVGLAAAYLLIKVTELNLMLTRLRYTVRWRHLVLAYIVGEMCNPLPFGVYAQNYVLATEQDAKFARSAAATSGMMAIEMLITMILLLVLPIPSWGWVRPIILTMFGLGAVALVIIVHLHKLRQAIANWLVHGRFQKIGRGLVDIVTGMEELAHLPTLLAAAGLASCYLLVLCGAFWHIAHGVGVNHLTFYQGLTIYMASLGAVLLLGGLNSQLAEGVAAGVGAALAWGYNLTQGAAMLIGFRLVWLAAVWGIGVPVLIWLRKELWAAARRQQGNRDAKQ